ncbi:MAG: T9SS C-terminal target domain-containing protein, partial [Bacteroidetes bacterium]
WKAVPPEAFTYNTYHEILPATAANSGNPFIGEWVFTGTDQGSNSGSWGTSIVDLSTLGITNGDSLRLRWELGTDRSAGYEGWFVDDIVVSTCYSNNLLPVEWLNFTATAGANAIVLQWETAQEYDNKGFFVERSTDGQQFYAQAWVAASTTQRYQWEDQRVVPGQWYHYRLRQVDQDETSSYSDIRRLRFYPKEEKDVWIYPNPVQDILQLHTHADEPIRQISLYTSTGMLVKRQPATSPTAISMAVSTADLPAGTYVLWVDLPTRRYQQLVVVL